MDVRGVASFPYLPPEDSLIGPCRNKTCLRGFANNKGADQPVHLHSLISTFVVHFWKVSYPDLLRPKFQFSS